MSAINESTVKLNDQKYVLTTIKDNKGFGLHFIPDSKTLDVPKNTQVDTITAALKKAMPALGDSIWYSINNSLHSCRTRPTSSTYKYNFVFYQYIFIYWQPFIHYYYCYLKFYYNLTNLHLF
jgi:hypothetical protein